MESIDSDRDHEQFAGLFEEFEKQEPYDLILGKVFVFVVHLTAFKVDLDVVCGLEGKCGHVTQPCEIFVGVCDVDLVVEVYCSVVDLAAGHHETVNMRVNIAMG